MPSLIVPICSYGLSDPRILFAMSSPSSLSKPLTSPPPLDASTMPLKCSSADSAPPSYASSLTYSSYPHGLTAGICFEQRTLNTALRPHYQIKFLVILITGFCWVLYLVAQAYMVTKMSRTRIVRKGWNKSFEDDVYGKVNTVLMFIM